MPLQTKLVLSSKELALIRNSDWFLTKKDITEKVYCLLNEMIPEIEHWILEKANKNYQFKTQPPKIYRGENYNGLPYVTLDFPRWFTGEDIFAVRTMFWWGNFFSITLHLAGKYRAALIESLKSSRPALSDFFICVHEEQWHHHFETNNYIPVYEMSGPELDALMQKTFIKIALKFDLSKVENIDDHLLEGYKKTGRLLT